MMKIQYLRAQELLTLEDMVNESILDGWEPFLPLVVRGESLIQPMVLRSTDTELFSTVGQIRAMYEIEG
jgi:hypothetical protein